MKRRVMGLLAVAGVVLGGCADAGDPRPAPVESQPVASAAGLQGRWWEWAASAPRGDDPVSDQSGEDCRRNQPADVWFLAGTFMATAQGTVDLDGSSVAIERIESEPVSFTGVAGNALGTETDRVDAVGCGLWGTIPALPAGIHQLQIRGGSGDFRVSVDYRLQVFARTA